MDNQLGEDQFRVTADIKSQQGGTIFEPDLIVTVECDTDGSPIIDYIAVEAITPQGWKQQTPPEWLERAFRDWVWTNCHDKLTSVAWTLYLERRWARTHEAHAYDRGAVA